MRHLTTRRRFLESSLLAGAAVAAGPLAADEGRGRPKVAVVLTWMTFRSHAHVILENFLMPYLFNGKLTDPGADVVGLYVDQFPEGDMSRETARRFKIPIFDSIEDALTLGTDKLAVDAVLCIGEHGNYPQTKYGIDMYPRKEWFDRCTAVMKQSGRVVPYYNDKHFSYRWDWAKEMYDTARAMKMPFMAGSSVPLAERRPPVEIPAGIEIEEAISIHGGPVERYDFHAFEVLQSVVENRKGGETGVKSVEVVKGDALKQALAAGRIPMDLYEAAMRAELGRVPQELGYVAGEERQDPHAIFLTYRDGLKATVLRVGKSATRWNVAYRSRGDAKPQGIYFYPGPWNNRNLFKALSHAIQTFFRTKKAPYPIERTLLTTGLTAAAVEGYYEGGVIATPYLDVAYQPVDFSKLRERGASWKLFPQDLEQPEGLQRDRDLVR